MQWPNYVYVRLRLHFVTNLIVAFVEFSYLALISLAFCQCFRYCVFARNTNGGNRYDKATSCVAVSVLRRRRYRHGVAARRSTGYIQKAQYVRQPPAMPDLPQMRCRAVPVRGRAS